MQADVALIGAGVIGLLSAKELAEAGLRVVLLERGMAAREASWAGGGIVSPLYPWRYSDPVTALASWSQSAYVHLAQELREVTDIDPELRQKGLLMLGVEDEDDALAWARRHYRPVQTILRDEILRYEPAINIEVERGLWMPEVASIRNPRLGQALRQYAMQHPNITLLENTQVEEVQIQNDCIVGCRTDRGWVNTDKVVVSAGAWSQRVLSELGVNVPIQPVRGQMMVFKANPGLLNRTVLNGGKYLIPRADGRILVGSTLEYSDFIKETTVDAAIALRHFANKLLPALQTIEPEHHWAGLRPGSPSGIPWIGALENVKGLYINAGHFRNGLVLAPASCRLLADILCERTPIVDPLPYQPSVRQMHVDGAWS
ncbi:glycine oxidase ThiO [Pokkaliibacter plantistimulans]|uniref:Glycine oxidase ThiO n=1 Tax=Proteobacteria bacterium 228 TaxID=2083153 RepID=A0A2S5KP80_9PROT|nr:glycine oxidase ThiO [Pokkaliibacter plantistimulans]PPC76339.1 glycine oxidase ThiO [Pokkaliibacter plantistimulans]